MKEPIPADSPATSPEKLQFRVLYRQFLFRMVDLELLSADARGDSSKLFGQFASLLVFLSIGLAVPVLAFTERKLTALQRLNLAWAMEHFLIATTMLVVGLFAVLCWDSTYPDRRDVMVLSPLPVRLRTLFLAKVAGVTAAIGLVGILLHCAAGIVWPALLTTRFPSLTVPALAIDSPMPPARIESIQAVLDRDIAPALLPGGALAPGSGIGAAVGISQHGDHRVFAYGAARPDSIFEIASISKTFTALIFAQMAAEGKVRLDEPVRDLLPPALVEAPLSPREITLTDLATHHSGLPETEANIREDGNPALDYSPEELLTFIGRRRMRRAAVPWFESSNLGFALLGQALANRAGMSYAELLQRTVTGPLGLHDTVLALDPGQSARLIPGYTAEGRRVEPGAFNGQAPARGIRSTAADLLTYLEFQLHPERYAGGSLAAAAREIERLRYRDLPPVLSPLGSGIGLAWMHDAQTGNWFHAGNAPGHTSFALFRPAADSAVVVLVNNRPGAIDFCSLLVQHIRQKLDGQAASSLGSLTVPTTGGKWTSLPRAFGAYWFTLLSAAGVIFGGILGIQGLAALLLPRRILLRVSSFLQIAALCAFLLVYFMQPVIATPAALARAQSSGLLSWSPSYWFFGLLQQLLGVPAFSLLSRRAWIALAIVGCTAPALYALSYLRTLRKIVEEPDIVPGAHTAGWLPAFGGARESAVVQFAVRTLLRSRQHRVLLAFYLGLGFAILIFLISSPATQQSIAAMHNPWRQVNLPMLSSSLVMMCALVMGARIAFAMPIDLRANWIFRTTPIGSGKEILAGRRRAMLVLSVFPVCAAAAALFFTLWPWPAAAGSVLVLFLLGAILTELSIAGPAKLPFTCSYLPGKSQVHLKFWFCLAVLLQLLDSGSEFFRSALESFTLYAVLAAGLTLVLIVLRWRTAASSDEKLHFEDSETPAVQQLGLYRDGVLPIEHPVIN